MLIVLKHHLINLYHSLSDEIEQHQIVAGSNFNFKYVTTSPNKQRKKK